MATLDALTSTLTSRIPPQSLEAERAILGTALLDARSLPVILDVLIQTDFYKDAHRRIYGVIVRMFEADQGVDLVTMSQALDRAGELAEIGGAAYLASLVEEAATMSHIEAYIDIVMEKSMLRDVIRVSTSAIGYAYEAKKPPMEVLQALEHDTFQIAERHVRGSARTMRTLLHETMTYIEQLYDRKDLVTGLASGLSDLDEVTSGFQRRDLIIVAGRPSSGKTAFALGVAREAAKDGKRVLVFSIEMAVAQLMARLVAAESRVDWHKIRTGFLEPSDWTRLTNGAGRLAETALAIDDSARLTPLELRTKARRFQAEGGLDLLVVDYIQLMQLGARVENRQQEVTAISRSLKGIAKELNVPLIALSQLSRAVESREKKEPVLSDLRESGAIEQDADVVMLLYRPDMYGLAVQGDSDSEIIVAKQRNGPVGRVPVSFVSAYATFMPMSRREPEPW